MTTRLELDSAEVWLVLSQLDAAAVIGIPNPTRGLIRDETISLRDRAFASLKSKGLASLSDRGQILVEKSVEAMLRPVVEARHTVLIAVRKHLGSQRLVSFHYGSEFIVQVSEDVPGVFGITRLGQRQSVATLVGELLPSGVSEAGRMVPFVIPGDALTRARSLFEAGERGEAIHILEASCAPRDSVTEFAPAVEGPEVSLSLVVFRDCDQVRGASTEGLSVIKARRALWMLEPADETGEVARVLCTSAGVLRSRIERLIPSL